MKINTFKNNQEPPKQCNSFIPEHRMSDFKPKQLNTPKFKIALTEHRNKHIAFSQSMETLMKSYR